MRTIQIALTVIFLICVKIGYSQNVDSMAVKFVTDWKSKVVYDIEYVNNPPKDSVPSYLYTRSCRYYAKSFEQDKYRVEVAEYTTGESKTLFYFFDRDLQMIFSLKGNKVRQVGFIKMEPTDTELCEYNFFRSGLFQRETARTSDLHCWDKQVSVEEFIKEFEFIIQQANL